MVVDHSPDYCGWGVILVSCRTYTHPDVFTIGIRDGWADPETDPTRIDWPPRQARAAIPFQVVDGHPVNPCEQTAVRYGRNELGHWGRAAGSRCARQCHRPGRRSLARHGRARRRPWLGIAGRLR